ncbi:class I SAM-dependent methyltransferase [Thermodesulforhabdus norvegica]|uniref:Ubiquinone/menaquinone biosynthesis C-methylase UbiE n=1 Tax=Thermodesulforhabdus norvegica TaxID=39841 RepID=A0A1I4QNZ0_9BACT|nr:class I SAM-dependent methyltransferase [Thermodesulforhabdus norvegica]SFM41403.1 Ubiquinone/menaquinone biosynthesis C-methylase UbiE [Thermodesulforhabdus norvegica]
MKTGSIYCNYEDAFKSYDNFRQPIGLKEVFQILDMVPVKNDQAVILEGGFGTGAYTQYLAKSSFFVIGLEASETGVIQARKRLKAFSNVHLGRGNILALPLKDSTVDVYFVSQVIHHLDDSPEFPNLDIFLKEARRVLKKGGFLIIHTCDPAQLDPHRGSYWHYEFIPIAARKLQQKYIPVEKLRIRLERLGFSNVEVRKSSGQIFGDKYYRDPTIFFSDDFWASDSVFSLVSSAEKANSCKALRTAIEEGSIHKIMEKHRAWALEIGETLILSARRD